jgi:hypothetical protein
MFTLLLGLMLQTSKLPLSDFSNENEQNQWIIVNDGVMGGQSEGKISFEDDKAVFSGEVSLKNYGGFTSIRKSFSPQKIDAFTHAHIRLKGDGKNYQFRVKAKVEDRHSYKYEFPTSGKWETIVIPLNDMRPTYRGYTPDLPNFESVFLSQIGFLIANKKAEKFELRIGEIWLE